MLIPRTMPISDLRGNQAQILDGLKEAPILLTRQGKAAAVLVDPDKWNALIELVEDLEDSVDALEAQLELATGKDHTVSLSQLKATIRDGAAVQG